MKNIISLASAVFVSLSISPIFAQNKEATFNNEYVKRNDGKTTIEIAEVQELVYIILSITPSGIEHPVMVNRNTEYYNDISEHFTKYKTHPVVAKFDSLLKQNLINYFMLAANAYGFRFKKDQIVPTGVYDFPAKGIGKFEVKTNPVVTYLTDLQDFANQSSFRRFYAKHKNFYAELKSEYASYASVDKQKQWLERHFDYKINSYRVLTSSLIGGMNATHTFEDNQFKEILLFLPTIRNDKNWDEKTKETTNARIIFTEIDHNYVGPVSARFLDVINHSVSDRNKWVNQTNKGTDHYPNPLKIFDEYLTWGVFLLYCHENYPNDDVLLNNVTSRINDMMVNKRGFFKAKEFNAKLLSLYLASVDKHIAALYPSLLDWCAQEQTRK